MENETQTAFPGLPFGVNQREFSAQVQYNKTNETLES
jgi:hypothetical protein